MNSLGLTMAEKKQGKLSILHCIDVCVCVKIMGVREFILIVRTYKNYFAFDTLPHNPQNEEQTVLQSIFAKEPFW